MKDSSEFVKLFFHSPYNLDRTALKQIPVARRKKSIRHHKPVCLVLLGHKIKHDLLKKRMFKTSGQILKIHPHVLNHGFQYLAVVSRTAKFFECVKYIKRVPARFLEIDTQLGVFYETMNFITILRRKFQHFPLCPANVAPQRNRLTIKLRAVKRAALNKIFPVTDYPKLHQMGIGRTPTFSAAALPLIVRSDTMPKTVALDLFLRRRSLAIIRTFVI